MWEDRIAQQEEELGKKIIQTHHIYENLQRDKEKIENDWKNCVKAAQAKHSQVLEELENTAGK
jgi:cell division septum initiation protein DivIVA